jgi:type I pantothenate kinase
VSAPETALPVADDDASPFVEMSRAEWARLRGATPLTLSQADVAELSGASEEVSLREVEEVYLPLSRLLNLHVAAAQALFRATDTFLGRVAAKVPYVIGVAGSVAAGKSTTSRVLRALLSRWPDHPRVDIVTTDGFLYPNRVLEERGLMRRKGFPESYDLRRLVRFLSDLKSGQPRAEAPVYSHMVYDVVPDTLQVVERPDIVIVEGLNVLQSATAGGERARVFVSDFFDFSIYIDAQERHLEQWFLERFQRLRATAFRDPESFFRELARLGDAEAETLARGIWREINGLNLRENVEPTRERARLILEKGADHGVQRVRLRRL